MALFQRNTQARAAPPAAGGTLADSSLPSEPWLFGKLPAHGDFLVRGVSGPLRDQLDDWLAAALARARARFSDDFDARYLAAPAWLLIDRGGDGGWRGAALCPSVDAVGRRFPLFLGIPAAGAGEAAVAARHCLELAAAAIGSRWDAGRLDEALRQPVPASPPPVDPREGWSIEGQDGSFLTEPGRFPEGLIERMLEIAG
ncbi:type VI secretion system-associated protein TagF [Novosphingobium tardum]|uniref:Type VI secretion system-associated protein TagF n=1 Tax=Novosphingobium tardum TaxID=1538021 RepID=A0ABV8RLZ6_9SPHN